MAEQEEDISVKVTESLEDPKPQEVPLTRKRTRDDFEDGEEEKTSDSTERKIAPLKRRKDTLEESEENSVKETVSTDEKVEKAESTTEEVEKNDTIAQESTEAKVEPKEETKEEKKAEETSSQDQAKTLTTDKESKEEVKDEDNKADKKEDKKEEKPRFVFGSTTPFGANAFSLMNKNKNVFNSSSSKETSKSPSASSTSAPVFGSNSKFGNAFQSAVTKKSIFDKTPEEEAKEKEDSKNSRDTTPAASGHLYKQVDLEKKEIKSGEEDEEQVFTCRAKLYTLDLSNVKEGWKERGVGNVHVNKSKVAGKKARIIMRSIGLLKVILNIPFVEGLEVVKGMPSSLASEKFIRITIVENGKPVQYALKTGNPDTTASLFDSINELIPKSV